MMNIRRFVCNMLQENCYVVSDDTRECVIIDCGAFYPEERTAIVDYIRTNQLTPTHLLATHGHLDHNFGNNTIFEEFGLKPEASEQDEYLMNSLVRQGEAMYGLRLEYDFPSVENYLQANQIVTFGNHKLRVLTTPGHSRGCICFVCDAEKVVFTGDTLFRMSIGRTDFEGGSTQQIIDSLHRLAKLPDETVVYPGHGPQSTIGDEKMYNPYMKY
ncbi:MAG: MBL fold metallo-hydrolase [Prevotella sp.]|nr:MBL fold metallo-hydrolase [Prevotella sp.]